MGAVKTNRREKALSWSYGYECKYGIAEWLYKGLSLIMERRESNNRRKMAGLPMIRRAKS
jgi:hypothetical protein